MHEARTGRPGEPTFAEVVSALHRSHDRLAATVGPLSVEQTEEPSYHDWTIAQVASHLGSGAENFDLILEAGRQETDAPGLDEFQPVWDRWNSKSPAEQVRDALTADTGFLDNVEALTPDERARWTLDLFGATQSLVGLTRMRLGEHALHTWDIVVALDQAATVADDAIALIIDNMPGLAQRVGKGAPEPTTVHVLSTEPERAYLLELTTDSARLVPTTADVPAEMATLRLPGEALVRLVYGRLDPDHTPDAVECDGVDLDTLRRAFPGL